MRNSKVYSSSVMMPQKSAPSLGSETGISSSLSSLLSGTIKLAPLMLLGAGVGIHSYQSSYIKDIEQGNNNSSTVVELSQAQAQPNYTLTDLYRASLANARSTTAATPPPETVTPEEQQAADSKVNSKPESSQQQGDTAQQASNKERFIPTEEISEDLAVSFPIDI
ncbi:hypothetical protein [Flocculibacter collagenilyticus]|uniref:hypothetical protein n=1 Tax=Flocculibacter collagenilyticus TaxID=2744479 RepID=UPI0018F3CC51|nr:hypothetical protein [Flocculibacter collagenilyticus]